MDSVEQCDTRDGRAGGSGLTFVLPDCRPLCLRGMKISQVLEGQGLVVTITKAPQSSHISWRLCWASTGCPILSHHHLLWAWQADSCVLHPPNGLCPPTGLVFGAYEQAIRAREERGLGGMYAPHSCPGGCLLTAPPLTPVRPRTGKAFLWVLGLGRSTILCQCPCRLRTHLYLVPYILLNHPIACPAQAGLATWLYCT